MLVQLRSSQSFRARRSVGESQASIPTDLDSIAVRKVMLQHWSLPLQYVNLVPSMVQSIHTYTSVCL